MEEITSPEHIREIACSFQESRILLSAFELGIFTILDPSRRMSSGELAPTADEIYMGM